MPTYKDVFNVPGNPSIPCGGCRRRVPVDMLEDVRHLRPGERPKGAPFVCDACLWRIKHGLVRLHDLPGAP